jgi:hypothetical protein
MAYGCAVGQDHSLPLDSPGDSVFALKGPALALAGHLAGYAAEVCDNATGDCTTNVFAVDLAAEPAKQNVSRHAAARTGAGVVKVGSLRVSGTGSLAWIACPERTTHDALSGSSRPNCVHRGARDVVLAYTPGADALRVLDAGPEIDPSSIQLQGHRLAWIHGASKRHAVLA